MKKYLLSLIATVMCISIVSPLQPVEADTNPSTTPETLPVQETQPPSFQKEIELIEERTATTQVFQQEDGAHRMEISPEPIHVQDAKTKKWVPIDNTLVEKSTGRHHNAKNDFDASFAAETASGDSLVSLKQQGKTVEIKAIKYKGKAAAKVDAVTEENQVTYEEIYPDTDLVYTVGNTKIKEDIVLKKQPAGTEPLSYSFDFQITGMTLERTADGYLYLLDAVTKDRVFTIEKPFMMDSSTPEGFVSNLPNPVPEGAWTNAIEVDAQQTGDQLTLTLKPDMAWLQDPKRVYPVVLDPTVKVYQPNHALNDTTIRSALPDTTGGADQELGAGLYKNSTTNNIVRSLLQFDVGTLPRGAKIMNAQLNLRLSSVWNDTAASIQLYETSNAWEEDRATWNRRTLGSLWTNKGGDYSSFLSSQTVGALETTATEPPLFKWPIKAETVQKWMDTPTQNLGLTLKSSNETLATYKKFYSSDASGMLNYSPKLTITYYPISRLGMENYWAYFYHDLVNGQGAINIGTGNLVVDYSDFSISGRGNSGFLFNRNYNSKAVEDSAFGFGWSFTGSETISQFPNNDVLYQDADGTTHLFDWNLVNNTYTAPPGVYQSLSKLNPDIFVLTDFNGNRTVFSERVDNPELQSRIYRIAYKEDRNQNRITFQRQVDGTLTGIQDATGRTLTLQYENGRVISTTFEGTKNSAYSYHIDGRLKSVTDFKDGTSGSITSFQYNSEGLLSAIIDPNGGETYYLYENGYLRAVQQPSITEASSTTIYDYSNLNNFIVIESDGIGNQTTYNLNNNYLVVTVTDPMKYNTTLTYDNQYNLKTVKDPKGNLTVKDYDTKGNLLSITDSLGNTVSTTYNNFSQPLTETDANGTVAYEYNSYGDLIKETNTLGESTYFTYQEPYGNLLSLTRPDGSMEVNEYDDQQNYMTKTTDKLNRSISNISDKYGNIIQTTDANGNISSYDYNEQNQLVSLRDGTNNVTSYSYDANGNMIAILNGIGNVFKFAYNDQNQFISRTEPLGQTIKLDYDAIGNLVKVTQPDGQTSVITEYDANRRPNKIKINSELKWTYGYDENGNKTSVINAQTNSAKSFSYDQLNQLKTESNGNQLIEYNYSPTNMWTSIIGSSGTKKFTQSFVYDTKDQLKNVYHNGSIQVGMDYTTAGLLSERRYVNGVHSFYSNDVAQQLSNIKVSLGTNVLFEETNDYDLNGNLTTVTSAFGKKVYSYDKKNQLSNQELSEFGIDESYSYDKVGNRISKSTIKNGTTITKLYEYDANNRLISADGQLYTYDDNGNRLKDGKYSYVYDKFNRLTSVKNLSGATISIYAYDEKGRRISKTTNGKTTNYHYDQGINVLFETDNSGNVTTEYIYDSFGLPTVMTKNNLNYYFIYNSNHEITYLTDQKGVVVASYTYDAWGNILTEDGPMATENPFRYKSYYYDYDTEMYYLIARYYEPTEGVFISSDPNGGDIESPNTQNGYNYAINNPVRFIDPDGHMYVDRVKLGPIRAGAPKAGAKPTKSLKFNTGSDGEKYLSKLVGGSTQTSFNTTYGKRIVDSYANKIAHESKVGYTSLTSFIKKQVLKDAELKKLGKINGAHWHFFRSGKTGKIGPSQPLLDFLKKHGIKYTIHYTQ
ncbi:DNRLRE domain-containing protein [Planococcus sp. FY231025]|uniref:DNRLRE domain-containing protein n=1 Tax=Planococcus sp. FY231025 TaxID=3455699 RepID=UPI003F8FC64B